MREEQTVMNRVGCRQSCLCAAGICALALAGCISHDQLHLANPSPCHLNCEYDRIACIDPMCHGYHPTCWKPWCADCAPCPPPCVGVAPCLIPGGMAPPAPEDLQSPVPAQPLMPESLPTPTTAPQAVPAPGQSPPVTFSQPPPLLPGLTLRSEEPPENAMMTSAISSRRDAAGADSSTSSR
jgi:hypothetical protein